MTREQAREASHAGSWYEYRPARLSAELDKNLAQVPSTLNGHSLPIAGARVIIAPHAGYSYSGPCAAWAYKALDLSGAKRVFLLGPSHTYYLPGCAITSFSKYETPFGDLKVDTETCSALRETGRFTKIPPHRDVEEHSLEMHLPYLWKRLEQTVGATNDFPTIVPILIGALTEEEEESFGQLFKNFLKDPANAFVISSDFCHWGKRFTYSPQYIKGELRNPLKAKGRINIDLGLGVKPQEGEETETGPNPPIHEVIRKLDELAMDAIETGVHTHLYGILEETDNTVCGAHPIGVVVAALEALAEEGLDDGKGRFKFVQYQRSSLVMEKTDYSVSYAAAYAVL